MSSKTSSLKLVSFLLLTTLFTGCFLDDDEPSPSRQATTQPEVTFNTTLLAHVDPHHSAGYSSIWGYTDANGREYALLGARSGTSIIDITNPASAAEVVFIAGPFSRWREIKTYQNYAYVVNETGGGIQIIDLSNLPTSATLAATFNGVSRAHTVTVDTTRAILYTSGGENSHNRIFSLANPVAPTDLGSMDVGNYVHDMWVQNDIAYLAEGGGKSFAIFDVSNILAPVFLKRFATQHASVAHLGFAHNIWPTIDGQSVLTTEEASGMTVKRWDISDLNHIRMTAEYLGPNQLAHNVHVKGNYAYLAHYGSGFRALDLTNPNSLPEVAAYQKAGLTSDNGVWGIYPYFRSGNIVLSDMDDGLYVVHFAGAVEP